MGQTANARAPLIVDSDAGYLESLRHDAIESKKGSPPFIAAHASEALDILQMHRSSIGILIFSIRIGRDKVLDLVHAALRMMPGLPVFFLTDTEKVEFSDDELRKMVVQRVMALPKDYHELLINLALGKPAITLGAKTPDQDFAELGTDNVSPTDSQGEDVYVRVRDDRYIKILRAGYAIGAERLERYIKRGIKRFYREKKSGS